MTMAAKKMVNKTILSTGFFQNLSSASASAMYKPTNELANNSAIRIANPQTIYCPLGISSPKALRRSISFQR